MCILIWISPTTVKCQVLKAVLYELVLFKLKIEFLIEFLIFGPFRQQPVHVNISHLFPPKKMLKSSETLFFLHSQYGMLEKFSTFALWYFLEGNKVACLPMAGCCQNSLKFWSIFVTKMLDIPDLQQIGNVKKYQVPLLFSIFLRGNKWLIFTRAGCCLNGPKIRNSI